MVEFDAQGRRALYFGVPDLHGPVVIAAGDNHRLAVLFANGHRDYGTVVAGERAEDQPGTRQSREMGL